MYNYIEIIGTLTANRINYKYHYTYNISKYYYLLKILYFLFNNSEFYYYYIVVCQQYINIL